MDEIKKLLLNLQREGNEYTKEQQSTNTQGYIVDVPIKFHAWVQRVDLTISRSFSTDSSQFVLLEKARLKYFTFDSYKTRPLFEKIVKILLEVINLAIQSYEDDKYDEIVFNKNIEGKPANNLKSNRVFIVHGHNEEIKISIVGFVEKLGLEPIILHEQPNEGRTIIEKFEDYSDVSFAIILLTSDDVGSIKSDKENLKSRARQNVIFELGFFIGKLKRQFVCVLFEDGIEIPSDYQGVLYIPIDESEGWKLKLAKELNASGMKINTAGLL